MPSGRRIMVIPKLPKLEPWVRFPSPAPRLLLSRIFGRAAIALALLCGTIESSPEASASSAKGLRSGVTPEFDGERWLQLAAAQLDERCLSALAEIRDTGRKLLAVRGYIRAGAELTSRWSWTQERIDAYSKSAEGRAASADVQRVIAAFESANPSYSLHVNQQPRSLQIQIAHWNENASVGANARALINALQTPDARSAFQTGAAQVRAFIAFWRPPAAIALAPPGLSAHGQGRAFDFQVTSGTRIVAGVRVDAAPQEWDRPGWTRRLSQAVQASHARLIGPLLSPYEPWHYSYRPDQTTSAGTQP